jgi:hypothetical protein
MTAKKHKVLYNNGLPIPRLFGQPRVLAFHATDVIFEIHGIDEHGGDVVRLGVMPMPSEKKIEALWESIAEDVDDLSDVGVVRHYAATADKVAGLHVAYVL